MAKISKAAQIRAKRGILETKNPAYVARGIKSQISPKAVSKRIDRRSAAIDRQLADMEKESQQTASVAIQTIDNDSNIHKVKDLPLQQLKKNAALKVFQEQAEEVGKRLVRLALGQGSFVDAPASVQRLAMMDVLSLAGINADQAEKQAKPVHEMNKHELESFINSTKKLIEKHDESQKGTLIEGNTLDSREL